VIILPRLWKKGKWILLLLMAALILLTASNVGLERANLSFIEVWLRDLLAPLESGATVVMGSTQKLGDFFTGYQNLLRERKDLQAEVTRLKNEVNALTEVQLENVRLRKLLGLYDGIDPEWETVPAKVIGRDPGNWFHAIIVNKGIDDGLTKDMAVVNEDGLVGRIISVSRSTAEVLLVVDKESAVGCLVQLSRTPGVVEGFSGNHGLLRMIHIPYDTDIQENQVVVSSGLGGIFPPGLRVGFITQVKVESNGLMKQALLQPFVDFDRLEEVLVLKERKR